jgi:glycolate oxidase
MINFSQDLLEKKMRKKSATLPYALKRTLSRILGKENVLFNWEDRVCYGFDALNQSYIPDAVLFPGSAKEISQIVCLANELNFSVIPRGAGSGFSGGSIPVRGGVVMSLSRLNQIRNINPEEHLAIVEPGLVTGDFQSEVEKMGLFYPPDPASLAFCTLGGNVAECAGGPRALKYGVTRDYVEGLEVVFPTGEILSLNRGSQIESLIDLMIGSEGTLGIITQIHLRLLPLPESRATMLAIFSKWAEAAEISTDLSAMGILPSTMEFMDASAIRSVESLLEMGLPKEAQAMLIIEVDGDLSSVQFQVERIKTRVQRAKALSFRIANDTNEADELWKARRAISPSLLNLKPHKINEDVVVPLGKLPSMLERISAISNKYGLLIANFGHAGDGNIHVNILFDRAIQGEEQSAHRATEEIFQAVVELGGALSGEHGIGISKAPFLKMALEDVSIQTMKKIKDAFDPNRILNPGKIF